MLLTILRLSIFVFSIYGYAVFFAKVLHIYHKVSWLAGSCFIILMLYVSAYLGLLYPTAIVLFLIGVLLAGYTFFLQRKQERKLIVPNLLGVWLLIYFVLFASTLLVSRLEHYDNYSHWAVIVKFLYTEGRLPAAGDLIISFPSYPMGSSLFLYFVSVVAGFSDSILLVGQFILIFTCIYGVFSVVRDQSRTLVLAMMCSFLAIFNHFNIAIRMNNLLVDFILPMMTLAGLAGMFAMRKQFKQLSFFTFLVAAALSIVKNSAIFFVVILLVYYLYCVIKMWSFRQNKFTLLGTTIGTLLLSVLPFLVWNQYVKLHYPVSKHEVNVSAYLQIFSAKDSSVTAQISNLFLSTVFDIRTLSTQGILLMNVILIGAYLVLRLGMNRKNSLLRSCLLINSVTVLYYFGIYFMFLFSMPTEEALYLAGFERYASSMLILALGLAMMVLAREMDYAFFEQNIPIRNYRSFKSLQTKKWYQYSTVLLLFVSTLFLLSENNGMQYNNAHFDQSVPGKFIAVTENNMELNEDRYLIVTSDAANVDSYLVGYVGKYYLYSPNVDARENFLMDAEPFQALISSYYQVVVLDEHFTFNAMMEKVYGQTIEPGIYDVATLQVETDSLTKK